MGDFFLDKRDALVYKNIYSYAKKPVNVTD